MAAVIFEIWALRPDCRSGVVSAGIKFGWWMYFEWRTTHS